MIQSLGSTSNIMLHTRMYLWSKFGALFQICTILVKYVTNRPHYLSLLSLPSSPLVGSIGVTIVQIWNKAPKFDQRYILVCRMILEVEPKLWIMVTLLIKAN